MNRCVEMMAFVRIFSFFFNYKELAYKEFAVDATENRPDLNNSIQSPESKK